MVLDGKSSQKYPVNAGVPQGSILGPTIFLLHINDLPDNITCNIGVYADDATKGNSKLKPHPAFGCCPKWFNKSSVKMCFIKSSVNLLWI